MGRGYDVSVSRARNASSCGEHLLMQSTETNGHGIATICDRYLLATHIQWHST